MPNTITFFRLSVFFSLPRGFLEKIYDVHNAELAKYSIPASKYSHPALRSTKQKFGMGGREIITDMYTRVIIRRLIIMPHGEVELSIASMSNFLLGKYMAKKMKPKVKR